MTVTTTFVPRPTNLRGPASSSKFNDVLAELLVDLQNLAAQGNTNENSITSVSRMLFEEFLNSRNIAQRYLEECRADSRIKAILGQTVYNYVDFRFLRGPDYYVTFDGLATARRARVEPVYGHVLLPYNHVVNRMFTWDPETGKAVVPFSIDAVQTGENEEGAESVDEGTIAKAFNGSNRDYWIRKVTFPLEHDVSDVAVTVDITLPDEFTDMVNMLDIHPFPLGQLDVEEIKYSTDSGDPTTDLTGFSVVRGAGFERWHFPAVSMTKLRIKLRQRNYIEEDGKKVFYLGAQEIGLSLVDFDQTAGLVQPSDNNGVVVVLEAPSGYKFSVLNRCFTDPAYATILSETGVRLYMYTDSALTNLVWSSYDNPRLEDTNVDVGSYNTDKLYLLVVLSFLTASGLSPILDNILVGYTTKT